MPKEGAFRERLLGFDRSAVPPTARTRLRRFISAEGGGGGGGGGGTGGAAAGKAAAPAGLAAVAAAVRAWCGALLRHKAAIEEAEMAREQTSCTVAMQAVLPLPPTPNPNPSPNLVHRGIYRYLVITPMQAACECVCDLHGMHLVEEDLKGSLLMAMRFPEADPTPSPEAEAAGEAEAGEDAEEDAEVAKLQERASTLRRFVGLMEEGLLLQAKELPLLQVRVVSIVTIVSVVMGPWMSPFPCCRPWSRTEWTSSITTARCPSTYRNS